jgi:hypothetical protein
VSVKILAKGWEVYICIGLDHALVQMCTHLYRVVVLTGINNVKAAHLYRVGWRRPRHAPVRGHLYRVVTPTGKKYSV